MNRAELKANAKLQIKGKIGILFVISLIIFAITLVAELILGQIPVIGSILAVALLFVIIKGVGAVFKNAELKKPHRVVFKDEIDVYETCGIEKIKKQRSKLSVFTDKRGKIRKIYRKKVLKNSEELIGNQDKIKLQYLTAKECCEKLDEPILKELYEKAKYSEKEITSEDIKLLK